MDKLSKKSSKSDDKLSKENSKASSKANSKDNSKDNSRDISKDNSKDDSKSFLKDDSKDKLKASSSSSHSRHSSKHSSKDEESRQNSKNSSTDKSKYSSKHSSKESSKHNSKDDSKKSSKTSSRLNSEEEKDKSTRSIERRQLRMSKQKYATEHDLSSDESFIEKLEEEKRLLEDEESKLLQELEDEVGELNRGDSRKQSKDYEQILDQQNAEQNLMSNLSFDSPCEFSLNSSDKEKLIKSEDKRTMDLTRSSSLYPMERSRLRSKFARSSQASIDGNLTMNIDGEKRRLSSAFLLNLFKEETAIQIDEPMTDDKMVESIKTARQIITNTKTQEWPIHRKLKYLKNAKQYLKKHEGDMKQSSQAKDILAVYRAYIDKALRRLKREIDNLVVQLTPWELKKHGKK